MLDSVKSKRQAEPATPQRSEKRVRLADTPERESRPAKAPIDLTAALAMADAKMAANPNPKFRPRPIPKVDHKVPVVNGHVPSGASILIIQRPWIDLILSGHKTLEIRGQKCSKVGERIYLALSGGGGVILGSAYFAACHGPLNRAEWMARADSHCVAGEALPYGGNTHAWELTKVNRFTNPVGYVQKQGTVVWAKM
jgi:hypothetical protein